MLELSRFVLFDQSLLAHVILLIVSFRNIASQIDLHDCHNVRQSRFTALYNLFIIFIEAILYFVLKLIIKFASRCD